MIKYEQHVFFQPVMIRLILNNTGHPGNHEETG